MPIRTLPPLLVNQIAAGEVIERPASVVKELVENSLDSGATRVEVSIEDGGRRLIRVGDNGCGIVEDDLKLAVAPHATSKIDRSENLAAIATLGFRGEALASIASVSRVRLTSRATTSDRIEESGHVLEAAGETVGDPAPAASAAGTIVEVRDLFFNTPVRRKFMRSAPTEYGHIAEILTRLAMVWPEIALKLIHDGRTGLDLPAGQTRRQRCVDLLGRDIEEALLEFESEAPLEMSGQEGVARLWGLAGLPSIARSSSKFQYYCLNGRTIRDRNIAHAVKEAYRGLMPPDRQPYAVVMLDVPPDAVDVNVHPTKAEVRFREPGRFHGLVLSAIRQRLLGTDLTPSVDIEAGLSDLSARDTTPVFSFDAPRGGGFPSAAVDAPPAPGTAGTPGFPTRDARLETRDSPLTASTFVDYFKRMDPSQRGFVYGEVKRAMSLDDADAIADEEAAPSAGAERDPSTLPNRDGERVGPILAAQGVLQIHKSYLVTQDDEGILIVDQHALHERVMFEKLRNRVLSRDLESQRLLTPATTAATPKRLAVLERIDPLLQHIGIEAAPLGPGTIGIHAFASFLFDRKVDPAEFLDELLDRAEEGAFESEGPQAEEAALHRLLDMMACKAAIKAGDQLDQEELAELLSRRDQVERSSACPHGRPTTIRLTLRDLEKHFGRK